MKQSTTLPAALTCGLVVLLMTFAVAATDNLRGKTEPQQYNLGLGRVIFTQQCIKCHGEPESGAPQLGQVDDWEARLQKPLPTLVNHAIKGHGEMPPKGGLEGLTDRDVSAAVAYVVDRGRQLIVEYQGNQVMLFDKICNEDKQLESCRQSRMDNALLLQMLWLITGQNKE
ncbi:MAG: c-type cytochrome [Sedimenticola sp.]|nr:c-type cytochrome [Sedimenticola sp.]